MSISSQTTYSKTKLELMTSVFDELNITGIGQTASSEDYARLSVIINDMLKAWTVKGPYLWATEEGVLFAEQYERKYKIGDTAHATTEDDLIVTQLNGNHATSISTITVDNTTGMIAGDYIGIVCFDKSLFWTTIDTVSSATSLILDSALTSAALDNALIYTYTDTLLKPLRIKNLRTVSGIDLGATSTLVELPVELGPYDDYAALPIKTTNNTHATIAAYLPKRVTGELFVFPRPSDCSYRLHFTFARDLAMLINTNDEIDLPQEWYECIKYQTMLRATFPYGKDTKRGEIAAMATAMLNDLRMQDQESLYIDVRPQCN